MDKLYLFLNSLIPKPFVWGECDCMLVLADWVQVVHGFDPASDIRFAYDSPASCQRLTKYFTDPVTTVARFAEVNAGFQRTDTPVKGDIGVVEIPVAGKLELAGAIFTGKSWAVKAPYGATTMIPYRVAAAWSVGYDPEKP